MSTIFPARYNGAMSTLFPDTAPAAEAVLTELLREIPPWRKIEMVGQLNQAVRLLVLAGLHRRYPLDTDDKLQRKLADIYLGKGLAKKVYGPLAEEI